MKSAIKGTKNYLLTCCKVYSHVYMQDNLYVYVTWNVCLHSNQDSYNVNASTFCYLKRKLLRFYNGKNITRQALQMMHMASKSFY